MEKFQSIREAKDYLAGEIVEEAQREGIALSEVERKMLYFSETGWTLPEMDEVSVEFDRDYKQDEYEAKIGSLVRGIQAREDAEGEAKREDWDDAVLKLCEGDHYLLTLIDGAASPTDSLSSLLDRLEPWVPDLNAPLKWPLGNLKRLILTAIVVIFVLFLLNYLHVWTKWR
jgi:hypothetical protein